MTERLRAFVGAEELNTVGGSYTVNNSSIVNKADLVVEANDAVRIGAVVDVKAGDGSTNLFKGRVHVLREPNVWELELLSNGYELLNVPIEKVYQDIDPRDVIADVVNNFTTTLSFDNTSPSSGVLLDEYVAQGYAIDVIRDMLSVLRWRSTISQSDVVRVAPDGGTDNGRVFTNGDGFLIEGWQSDDERVFNHVRVEAGFELPRKIQSFSATDTVFALDYKPESSVRVVVSGNEVSPDDYKVEPENVPPRIVFDSSVTDPLIEYTWRRRIVVEDENQDSIVKYQRVYRKVDAPYIITRSDARNFARALVDEFGTEDLTVTGRIPDLDFSLSVNERVRVVDPLRAKNVFLVVNEIQYLYDEGATKVVFGRRDFDFVTWQLGVQDRIKQLERRFTSGEERTFVRSFTSNVDVSLGVESPSEELQVMTANDSLLGLHATLGYWRASQNDEVDCSGNGLHGVWQGSGIDGDQYVKAGQRLYCGGFNGTNNRVDVTGTASGVRSVCFAVAPDINNRPVLRLTTSASISINSSGEISTTGLSGVSVFVNGVATNALAESGWSYVTVNCDSITANSIRLGWDGSSYYDGLMDEVSLFNAVLTLTQHNDLRAKKLYPGTILYDTLLLAWYSFDNPLLGDHTEDITEAFFA